MNSGYGTRKGAKVGSSRAAENEPSAKTRPLFVCGCQRSGTTAFTDYMNQHQEILLCQERYTTVPRAKITPDAFTFERILDYRPEETNTPWKLDDHIQVHAEILAKKDPAKLKWIGDKNPSYVRAMDVLAGNNPGARFIALYRPIEEVAKSWDIRAKNPDDHWSSNRGAESAVQIWNSALRKMREFVESSPAPRLLIVRYHDFFYRNEAVVPLISRFLGLEFNESVTRAWRDASLTFQSGRRRKEKLSEEQRSFIEEHADRVAEAWVLDRIERQWKEPSFYVEESTEAALALLDEIEARMWRLQRTQQRLIQRTQRQLEIIEASRKASWTWKLVKVLRRVVKLLSLSRRRGSSS